MATARSIERARAVAAVALLLAATALAAAATAFESPAERRIARAEARVAAWPRDAEAHRMLAVAHTQRARERASAEDYERALRSLARARELGVDGPGADVVEAWVRLGRHEFARAQRLARRALAAQPDDPAAWGVLGDAQMELGRFQDAASAYQRMADLRPGPSAYLRAAYYREATGDLEGATELLHSALRATPAAESEQRAWTLVRLAGVEDARGALAAAASYLEAALRAFPGYHDALSAAARLALRQGDPARAERAARAALAAAGHPELRLVLADALRALGREREAREQEHAFEREALANAERADNENVFLVDFYLDRRPDPDRAFRLARREVERRRVPATLERLDRARAALARAP